MLSKDVADGHEQIEQIEDSDSNGLILKKKNGVFVWSLCSPKSSNVKWDRNEMHHLQKIIVFQVGVSKTCNGKNYIT